MIARDSVWLAGEPALMLSAHGILTLRWGGGEAMVLHADLYVETLEAASTIARGGAAESKVTLGSEKVSTIERGISAEVPL